MLIKDFAEKYIKAQVDAWNGFFNALEVLETPNVVYHMGAAGETLGWEAHKQFLITARNSTSQRVIEWRYIVSDGNLFVLTFLGRYGITKEIMGIPPGKQVISDQMFVYRLENGKVSEAWMNGNTTVSDT